MLRTLKAIWSHPLNRPSPLAAIGRFLRWQLANRVLPVAHVMPFVDDTVLVMERGMTGATGNWYSGLHEAADMAFVLHVLRAGDLFVDVGANVGSYTVLASGATGARTLSFEPIAATFASLLRNVAANGLGERVTCHNLGLGARDEVLRFTAGQDTKNRVATGPGGAGTVEVPVRRLDDILDGAVPRVAKIDVEGWEAEVIAGMPATLRNPGLAAIVMETNDSAASYAGEVGRDLPAVMRGHGFLPCSYDPFARTLVEGGTRHNTIFVRDTAFVLDRVRSAPRFRLVNGTI